MAFELEKQIAACHWDKVRTRDMTKMYFPQTWDDFTAAPPTLEWDSFLAGAELPREAVSEVVNAQRTFLGDVAKLVIPENLDRWRAWARWPRRCRTSLPEHRTGRWRKWMQRPSGCTSW